MPRRLPETADSSGLDEFAPADEAQTAQGARTTRRQQAVKDSASAPRSEALSNGDRATGSAGRGWAAHRQHKQQKSGFAKEFRVTEGDERLIKFLDDEPFETYYRHWLRGVQGRQTYVCLGDDCPLCDVGDQPAFVVLFNIVDLTDGERETVSVWLASPNPAAAIEEFAFSDKHSPINRTNLYFSVTKKKGANGFFSYSLVPVKDRDLPDDWEMQPLTDMQLMELEKGRHGSEFIRPDTRQVLKEVAGQLEEA
jgi:hypothetical protein